MRNIFLLILALILLLSAYSPAPAGEVYYPRADITVYPAIVAPKLPDEVQDMTPEEFHDWAVAQNKLVTSRAHHRNETVKSKLGDRSVRGTITMEKTSGSHRLGGGVGWGGYGGEGGYAGYSNQFQPISNGFNYGFGFSNPGNTSQTSHNASSISYEKVWYDNSYYGGTVTIINPFCPPVKK